ncbi:MAG: ribonuclease HII [Chloroflexi bacterium]|nr:ribonuclease HII [Chloroflexota bacterium]
MQDPLAYSMPSLVYERKYWASGYRLVAGLDEAGRGALAGPVVAAAVVLSRNGQHESLLAAGVRDSKQLTPARREQLFELICQRAEVWAVGLVSASEIDRLGIVPATQQAMGLALQQLPLSPEALLIDYLPLPEQPLPQQPITHGDQLSLSIAAASILAKVTRDRMLIGYESAYPGYGFARHKGYGTAAHRAALAQLGPCALHRRSFRPVREVLET